MKKALIVALIAVLSLGFFVSCKTVSPVNATSNPLGTKVGQATQNYLFGFIPIGGDAGIATAARNGGISKISTVDQSIVDYFVFATITTVVTGE